jgi:adenine-specific DNA methylase
MKNIENDDNLKFPFYSGNKIVLFKPITYLGSKLRILDVIEETINKADPSMGRVYDLFSGSGIVSRKLSLSRPVTSIDIQEYSRTISSALLLPKCNTELKKDFLNKIHSSEYFQELIWAIEPLVEYEKYLLENADAGLMEQLYDLVENGSLVTYEYNKEKHVKTELGIYIEAFYKRFYSLKMDKDISALITRHAGGIYFSYLQAAQIDIIRHHIDEIDSENKDIFLAALVSTASEAVNTVGKQFAQPLKLRNSNKEPKKSLLNKVLKDRSTDIFSQYHQWINKYMELSETPFDHKIFKMDYFEALKNISPDTKVIYADPPYTRDHYSRYYHTLETICLNDSPQVSTKIMDGKVQISRGVYREDRHQSPFCIKSKAPLAFEQLFSQVREHNMNLVLSYSPYSKFLNSRPRLLTIEQLIEIGKRYYKEVTIISPGEFRHSKLNHSDKHLDASNNAELLLLCKN